MQAKTDCSYDYLDFMSVRNYHEATRCALEMLEVHGDVLRHHEMMLTVNLRRENIAAALENCGELISYGQLKGLDITEYAQHREALLLRLSRTRSFLAAQLWDDITADHASAPGRYAAVPLQVAGEALCRVSQETGAIFLIFPVRGNTEQRIACRLAPEELPFIQYLTFPQRITVHGYFLSVKEDVVVLHPCRYLSSFETFLQ